ncbi:uncharacterized protein BJ171DRAFT_538014 [Polychytrium aggregatum]|uniref:uncharacterized protein n=1 Tax=Polychytrium aggregatum TaxID=110093 RepID=UPI0022FF0D03|nr:uncharacterized protein BJ171DRAFT_538014 [Polychytrium aggregatum]KAI9192914.1 hypothetical protein BJ171DRAFT_538014 [Polychytrium aggregatum]
MSHTRHNTHLGTGAASSHPHRTPADPPPSSSAARAGPHEPRFVAHPPSNHSGQVSYRYIPYSNPRSPVTVAAQDPDPKLHSGQSTRSTDDYSDLHYSSVVSSSTPLMDAYSIASDYRSGSRQPTRTTAAAGMSTSTSTTTLTKAESASEGDSATTPTMRPTPVGNARPSPLAPSHDRPVQRYESVELTQWLKNPATLAEKIHYFEELRSLADRSGDRLSTGPEPASRPSRAETSGSTVCYPITPQLQSLLQNPDKVEEMRYRVNRPRNDASLQDIFDGNYYKVLQKKRYFYQDTDIELALNVSLTQSNGLNGFQHYAARLVLWNAQCCGF